MKLCLPEEIFKQHLAVLGKTGSGKSSVLRYLVEHLLDRKKRVVIIDPKGDWWGLKTSADGTGPGYEIIAFGDFKEPKASDVPVNAASGKHVAELVATGNRPCIIGFRGWTTADMVRFWIDFAATLFNLNSGELFLVGDEFHNFAPKGRIMDPQAGQCLHWSNRIMSEGRGLGLVCLIASQRPQKVHNDTLTCCETLIALRVIHEADRNAIRDWIDGCGDRKMGAEMLDMLANLPRGEAYVWSPEIKFGPVPVKFPLFATFDSFAPPQLQKKIHEKSWADVNLEDVRAKLASVIEEQKANDPKELKRLLAAETKRGNELETKLSKATSTETAATNSAAMKPKIEEVPVLVDTELRHIKCVITEFRNQENCLQRLEKQFTEAVKSIRESRGALEPTMDQIERELLRFTERFGKNKNHWTLPEAIPGNQQFTAPPERARTHPQVGLETHNRARVIRPPAPALALGAPGTAMASSTENASLGKCERAILTALAQYPTGRSAVQIALLAGYSVNSGSFRNALGRLRSLEYIGRGDPIRINGAGLYNVGDYAALPTGIELARHWIAKLPKCEAAILKLLVTHYPAELTAQQVGETIGYSPESGSFRNALGRLRTLELITRGQPMKATDEFFQ